MKNRFAAFNILIAIALLLVLVLSLIFTFTYEQPTELKQQTGVVSKFNQYDEKWYDNIFGNSKGSCFNVWFEDDSYFEATGICYDYIDRRLFENLQIGEEITIMYFENGGLRKLCAIEYNGETYLSFNDVLNEYKQNEKVAHIVGPIIMVFSISVGAVLFIVNYKKNRGK
ncbi:MAG: hypothetical protein IJ400_00070 [Clostridia bacterium]|nr:hypothetical protein [Clostridia bacterium]